MEVIPQSIYNVVLLEKWRIQDASGVSLVNKFIMNTSVQLEFNYED
jgi:hypothetical protein